MVIALIGAVEMSKLLEAMRETAKDLYGAGVMDAFTMRQAKELCLSAPEKMSAEESKQLRLKHKVSQAVFAKYLNVKPVTVKKWELGANSPGGPALKLLCVIKHFGLEPLQFQALGAQTFCERYLTCQC